MRKYTFFTVFFMVCFSLFGQEPAQPIEYKIYVSPIAGYGKEKDNNYFYKQLIYEVFFQNHIVVDSPDSSNYTFKGTIEPVSGAPAKGPGSSQADEQRENYKSISKKAFPPVKNSPGRREYFSIEKSEEIYFIDSRGDSGSTSEITAQMEEKGYYFILDMIDSRTGEVLGTKKMLFYVTDASVGKLVSVIVYDLLAIIPTLPARRGDFRTATSNGDSRDRWLYFETSALWMPKIYYEGYKAINLLGYGMKLGIEFHFVKFLSIAAGGQATQEYISATPEGISDFMLEVPAALKFVFKVDNYFSLEPYGGAAWNYSIGKKIKPSEFSWFAGFQLGIKDKSETGMFIIDPRFSMDFYNSSVSFYAKDNKGKTKNVTVDYRRYCAQIGLGYKFGIIQKKK